MCPPFLLCEPPVGSRLVADAAVSSWPCDHGCWLIWKASLRTTLVIVLRKTSTFMLLVYENEPKKLFFFFFEVGDAVTA